LKHLPVVGFHDYKFHVLALGEGRIRIHGNPAKFLQGHNLFGTDDLKGLAFAATMARICKLTGIQSLLDDRRDWKNGHDDLCRIRA
jgi:II/X family phage/plasmid replication protein